MHRPNSYRKPNIDMKKGEVYKQNAGKDLSAKPAASQNKKVEDYLENLKKKKTEAESSESKAEG